MSCKCISCPDLGILSGAHIAREETKCIRSNSGESQPSNLSPDGKLVLSWKEVYEALWKLKVFGSE